MRLKYLIKKYQAWKLKRKQAKEIAKQAQLKIDRCNNEGERIRQAEAYISWHQDDSNRSVKQEIAKILDVSYDMAGGMYFDLVLGIYIEKHTQELVEYRAALNTK